MKIDSKEVIESLRNYPTKNDLEKMAVQVLLSSGMEVLNIPGLTDMDSDSIDELARVIKNIREELCIDD